MKMTRLLLSLAFTFTSIFGNAPAFAKGRIQNEDVKSLAEITNIVSITGNITSGNACITSPSSLTGLSAGLFVYDATLGTRINSGVTIAGIPGTCSAGQIQMSATAVGSGTGDTITFGGATSQLINSTKIYDVANQQTLASSITSGALGGGGAKNYLQSNPGAESSTTGWVAYSDTQTATITNASPAVFTITSTTGMSVGMPVNFTTSGSLPTGLTASTIYYVSSVLTGTTFKVSATKGGVDVNTSSAGSGTHTFRPLVPLNGGSGSPTGTLTRTITSPLNGIGSFIWTKPASNNSGEGYSYDFTIDSSDQAKVLQISFNYILSSGTFVAGGAGVDSDLEFYIYDKTNAVMIQPSTYKIFSNSSVVPNGSIANFQTASNSTSYRLIVHQATVSASAFVLKTDSYAVSPTNYSYNTIISDWKKSSTIITATSVAPAKSSSVTVDILLTRRVGSGLEVVLQYTQPNGTAGTTGTGDYLFGWDTGISADSSLISFYTGASNSQFTNKVGDFGGGSSTNSKLGSVVVYDATHVRFLALDASGTGGNYLSSTTVPLNAEAHYNARFTIPVLGWASQQQTSDINDQRIVVARYHASAANTGSGPLNFDVLDIDTHSAVTTGSGVWKFTAPIAGIYRVSGNTYGGGTNDYKLYKNGSLYASAGNGTVSNTSTLAGTIQLAAGDFISITPAAANSFAANTGGTIPNSNWVSIERVANPQQISSTETVAINYTQANVATANGATVLYDTKVFDTHGAYNPLTGKFTAPIAGTYLVSWTCTSVARQINCRLVKNGALGGPYLASSLYSVGASAAAQGTSVVMLVAGDTLEISNGNGSTELSNNTQSDNRFEIVKVGM